MATSQLNQMVHPITCPSCNKRDSAPFVLGLCQARCFKCGNIYNYMFKEEPAIGASVIQCLSCNKPMAYMGTSSHIPHSCPHCLTVMEIYPVRYKGFLHGRSSSKVGGYTTAGTGTIKINVNPNKKPVADLWGDLNSELGFSSSGALKSTAEGECTCPKEIWMHSGCKCGAMDKDREEMRKKGWVK